MGKAQSHKAIIQTPAARAAACLLCLLFCPMLAHAKIHIEPSEILLNSIETVPPGHHLSFRYTLERGTQIAVKIQIPGGIQTSTNIWFVRETDYRRFVDGQKFRYLAGNVHTSGDTMTSYFTAPSKSLYYIIIDRIDDTKGNPLLKTGIYAIHSQEQKQDAGNRAWFMATLSGLRSVIDFKTMSISVLFCDINGYRALSELTICKEDLVPIPPDIRTEMVTYSFYHLFAHALLRRWDIDDPDNEKKADALATYLALATGNGDVFLDLTSRFHTTAVPTTWGTDRPDDHVLTPDRAAQIRSWLLEPEPLLKQWQWEVVPRATYGYVQRLMLSDADWIDRQLINQQRAYLKPNF